MKITIAEMHRTLRLAFVLPAVSIISIVGVGNAAASITIATVPVGNAGNAPDPSTGSIYGEVDYNYNIGEYDVTSSQYTAFLNAVAASDPYGVYNSDMAGTTHGNPGIMQSGSSGSYTYSVAAGRGNYPATDVTFWDTTRFANWLANGQPTGAEGPGTTETGSYTLTPTAIANNTVTRSAGASWAVTNENEWYKAAYYSQSLNSGNGGYWLYPTQSNTMSTSQANYDGVVGDTTPVGSYPYPSYYGTYDQGGDVWQWNESIEDELYRGLRGGSFVLSTSGLSFLQSNYSFGGGDDPWDGFPEYGFRVSQVPEPTSIGIAGASLIGLLVRRSGARKPAGSHGPTSAHLSH